MQDGRDSLPPIVPLASQPSQKAARSGSSLGKENSDLENREALGALEISQASGQDNDREEGRPRSRSDRTGLSDGERAENTSTPRTSEALRLKGGEDKATSEQIETKLLLQRCGFPVDENFAESGKTHAEQGKVSVLWIKIVSGLLGTLLLMLIVIQALFLSIPRLFEKKRVWDPEQMRSTADVDHEEGLTSTENTKETPTKEFREYARARNLDILEDTAETGDGFYLRVHHVIDPRHADSSENNKGKPYPILILHGLFQGSGSFITNGDKSIAFWLVKAGYDVWLGNQRTVYGMGHRTLSRSDPRFWDHTIREYAKYDLPALVLHVCRKTGFERIAYVGHSQGTSVGFLALSIGMVPQLGDYLDSFTALAPAVFRGPIMEHYPFKYMRKMGRGTWKWVFGNTEFQPIFSWAYKHVPSKLFASAGYLMFSTYFKWTDTNWVRGRRIHHFRFMPTTVSSKNIFWWTGHSDGFGCRGCILNDSPERWYDARFPYLALFTGGADYLVDGPRLIQRLSSSEQEPDVHILLTVTEDDDEHLDSFYGYRSVDQTYRPLIRFIEDARQLRSAPPSPPPPESERVRTGESF